MAFLSGSDWGAGSRQGSESDSDGPYEQHELLDTEAIESDGTSIRKASVDSIEVTFFGFSRLPIELRRRIWEFFCPDLVAPSRVFQFMLIPEATSHGFISAWEGLSLDQQTAPARAVLSTHRESRTMALKVFPHVLEFRSGLGVIHFNRDKDIILVSGHGIYRRLATDPGFAESINHLALDALFIRHNGAHVSGILRSFPNLLTIYFAVEDQDCKTRHLRWCASDSVNHYLIEVEEEESGSGEHVQFLYAWPDLDKHCDFAERHVPVNMLAAKAEVEALLDSNGPYADAASGSDIDPDRDEEKRNAISIWPMVQFSFESGLQRLYDLEQLGVLDEPDGSESDDASSTSRSSRSDIGEYESDGIDDDDVIEDDDTLSDEDDLVVQPLSGDSSDRDPFSPPENQIISDHLDGPAAARFSSPESESQTADETDAVSQDHNVSVARRAKRRIVTSDSEDDSEPRPGAKRRAVGIRRRPMMVESEVEDESQDGGSGGEGRFAETLNESSVEDESEDEESPDDVRPMSLAEKLQLNRQNNPISTLDEEPEADSRYHDEEEPENEDFEDDDEGAGVDRGLNDEHGIPGDGMFIDIRSESEGSDEMW